MAMMERVLLSKMDRKIHRLFTSLRRNHTQEEPKYRTSDKNIMDKERKLHPFRTIHPWRSKIEFSKSMTNQVIYNEDGLVAINKPYGISAREEYEVPIKRHPSGIPNEVDYTVADAIPLISKTLGYESLQIIRTPEKYTSGVMLLGASEKIGDAVAKSLRRAEGARLLPRTFWTVTRQVPKHLEGEKRVAMTLQRSKERKRPVPVIINTWSKNARERNEIKTLNVQYKVLCHGTYNLASLLEIKASTMQWHAVRLFTASVLLTPVLGDRLYGSRAQIVMGKCVAVNPMVDAAHMAPRLDPDLLEILKIGKGKDEMIPVHMHLREMFLPWFLRKGNDVVITAPLYPEFLWTCRQLNFDENVFETNDHVKVRKPLDKRNVVT